MTPSASATFACDAMLGGLARWLRAAGYDASWKAGIADWELIRTARYEDRMVLRSDTVMFRRGVIRAGGAPALFVPNGLAIRQELAFVLQQLDLPLGAARCMACGGTIRAGTS